jgi:Flp pilus assembly protein TadD
MSKKKRPPVPVKTLPCETAPSSGIRRAFPRWLPVFAACAVLVVLTLAAYWPVTQAGFTWDDDELIWKNHNLVNATGLRHIWLNPDDNASYFPALLTAFWLQYQVWGADPLGYHMVNVLLHGLNAVWLFVLLRRLKVRGAWLAGLIFGLHPVFVESVAWVAEMKNTLSGFFYLAALYFWVRYMERDDGRPAGGASAYALAWFSGVLAVLSKPIAVFLAPTALLLAFWRERRLTVRRIAGALLLLLPAVAFSLYALHFEKRNYVGVAISMSLPLADRIFAAGRSFWFYLGKLLWPADLVMIYPMWHPDPSAWAWYVPLAALAAGCGCVWIFRRRFSLGWLIGMLYFAGTVLPIPFLGIGYLADNSYVADHFLYLPGMGFAALAAAGMARTVRAMPQIWRHALPAALAVLLGVLTWRQSALYEGGGIRIWERVLAVNPDNRSARTNFCSAQNNLGALLGGAGRFEEAIPHFEQALRINPDDPRVYLNLGYCLRGVGRVSDAIPHYEQALRLKPDMVDAHVQLAAALCQAGRAAEAIPHYEEVLRRRPDDVPAMNSLAGVLAAAPAAEGGDVARGVALARRACVLTGNQDPACLATLAMAHAAGRDFDNAIPAAKRWLLLAQGAGNQEETWEAQAMIQELEAQKESGRSPRVPARAAPELP